MAASSKQTYDTLMSVLANIRAQERREKKGVKARGKEALPPAKAPDQPLTSPKMERNKKGFSEVYSDIRRMLMTPLGYVLDTVGNAISAAGTTGGAVANALGQAGGIGATPHAKRELYGKASGDYAQELGAAFGPAAAVGITSIAGVPAALFKTLASDIKGSLLREELERRQIEYAKQIKGIDLTPGDADVVARQAGLNKETLK